METIVSTEGLSKEYGGVFRVKHVDLQIREGEVYGFLGPNGAGKSTTMKMLLGLVKPTQGTVHLFGKQMNDKNRVEILRQTGALIESPSYYGHLTGMENLRVMQKLLDIPEKNLREALRIVRLENQAGKKVSHYSLGMKQRLGIAMALMRFPKLLVLDEPTNGLDPAGIEEIRELIKALPQQYGMTVMLSSHLLAEVDQMATAVGIIYHGELIFQNSLEVLRRKSAHYVAVRTQDPEEAARLLERYRPKREAGWLLLENLSDAAVAQINQQLVCSGVQVFRIEERQRSLEEIFLDLTGKEGAL